MKSVRQFYETLGPEFVKALDDMIVFDALIYNVDRHFGNFGLLIPVASCSHKEKHYDRSDEHRTVEEPRKTE